MLEQLGEHDAMGLAQLIARGELDAAELLEATIAKIEALNPLVNAVVTRMYDEARAQLAGGLPSGPLAGVPFLLKDLNAAYAGVATTAGSRLFAIDVPDYDSHTVASYKRAGLLIVGKTNTPELGLNVSTEPALHGITRNPWHPGKSAGGSSGGAAAAVATGMVPAAHASDGGGSIRIPAACCGLFGLKPSRGRVSQAPSTGEGWLGMSREHAITRSVRDSALLLDIVAGYVPGDPLMLPLPEPSFLAAAQRDPGVLRIAIITDPANGAPVHPDCLDAVTDVAELCVNLGHHCEPAPLVDHGRFVEHYLNVVSTSVHATVARRCEVLGIALDEATPIEPVTRFFCTLGAAVSGPQLVRSLDELHHARRDLALLLDDYDVVLCPALNLPPLDLGILNMSGDLDAYMAAIMTYNGFAPMFNISGQPSMNVPLFWSDEGLPIGTVFSARYGGESLLLSLAAQLEQARPWKHRRPALR